jgi:hypothetical protein
MELKFSALLKTKDLVLEIFIHHSNVIILLNYFATLAGSLTITPKKNCRNYVYLEVTFSISGSLTEAKNN